MSVDADLAIFTVAVSLCAVVLAGLFPRVAGWNYIDVAYYPLCMLGVVLFFVSNAAERERADDVASYYSKLRRLMEPQRAAIDGAFHVLAGNISEVMKLQSRCEAASVSSEFRKKFCKNSLDDPYGALPSTYYALEPTFLVPPCSQASKISKSEWWIEFRPEQRELTSSERERIGGSIAETLRRCDEAALFEKSTLPSLSEEWRLQLKRKWEVSFESFPEESMSAIRFSREWLWPFVIVLALALKVGKAVAGLRKG